MDRINQYPLYEFGKTFKAIEVQDADVPASTVIFEIFMARNAIETLLNDKFIPLGISKSVARDFQLALEGIFDRYFVKRDESGNVVLGPDGSKIFDASSIIPSWQWSNIKSSLARFETVFAEELREAATYNVPRRGIYSTSALVNSADETFPADLQSFIPQKSKAEWNAAGRCLAFSLRSASGFHVARAVEGMLEVYVNKFCGAPRAANPSWGNYIDDLERSIADPLPTPKTLAELRQMKDDYRNPIMHPRVVLDEADARMLFLNGESLIIAMAQDVRASASVPTLTVVAGSASP